MGSYLKISYNQIPRICDSLQVASYSAALVLVPQASDAFPVNNLFYGGSSILWRNGLTAAVAQSWFTLVLRSDVALQTVDHIILRGLNLMFGNNSGALTVQVYGSLDNFVSSNVLLGSQTNILATDLVGSYNEDFILPLTLSAGYSSFRVKMISTNECPHRLRKLNLGKFFDFSGKSPYYPYSPQLSANGTPFTADAGTRFKTSMGRRGRLLSFAWRGITDADRIFFDENINRYLSDYPIFFYEPPESDHEPLSNKTLACGWAEADVATKDWKNNNQIAINFVEDIVG